MDMPPLLPGDTIGVMAPSSYIERAAIEAAAAAMEARGYSVFIHPQTFARHHQFAGTRAEKLEALHALYADPAIKVIWAAGGGNRALELLDGLDYDLIRANPKMLAGFSDVTALLNAINAHTGQIGLHTQVFKNMSEFGQVDATLDLLAGKKYEMSLQNAQIMQNGNVTGRLIGGNLSLFQYLAGTADCPPLEGAILCLEDCGDELSRFDRMFLQLRRLRVFEQIGGLILGAFSDLRDTGRPFEIGLPEIIKNAIENSNIPVVLGAPFGHSGPLYPLKIGAQATLDTAQKLLRQ